MSIILIIKKSKGVIDSIDRMGEQNKGKLISCATGIDYNNLLALVRKEREDLFPYLPPAITNQQYNDGSMHGDVTFAELHSFYNQIINLLES